MIEGCGAAQLPLPSFLPGSPLGFSTAAISSLGTPMAAPAGGGAHSGSAVASAPFGSARGPAPDGIAGGSAAGAFGLAFSIFLTLAGLFLLRAPRAIRRLWLSNEPWLVAPFVLIPERPG